MKIGNKINFLFALSVATSIFYSCAKQKTNDDESIENRTNLISSYSATSDFNHINNVSKITKKDIAIREKNCPLTSTTFKQKINKIAGEYQNKNLLDQTDKDTIPIFNILSWTSALTSSNSDGINFPYSCFYPEIYLANAIAMNALQKIPFAPFNQENYLINSNIRENPENSDVYDEKEITKNSRFAKLNGLIRTATLAYKITEIDQAERNYIPRIYSGEETKKVYFFDLNEKIFEENYYKQILSFARALAGIGHYERAIYRWNGIFSANEFNMQVLLPNESLQEHLSFAKSSLEEPYKSAHQGTNSVALKYIIAHDLLLAEKNINYALNSNVCQFNSGGQQTPAHMLSICPTLEKIREKVRKVDLKRLVCSSSSFVKKETKPDDVLGNYLWEDIQCDSQIKQDPNLANTYLDPQGISFHSITPLSLNPLKLSETINDFQKSFDSLKTKLANITLLQTRDYENKRIELSDNIEALKDEHEVLKRSQNKASQEIAYASFQRDTAKSLFHAAENDIEITAIEQKNQFRNYVTNLSSIQTYQKLKDILNNYATEKRFALDRYNNELCGANGASNCNSGNLGKLASLLRERKETITHNWKNSCSQLVNKLKTNMMVIGENGCDIPSLTEGVSYSDDPKIIAGQIGEILKGKHHKLTSKCKAAVVAESMAHLEFKDFDKLIDGNESDVTISNEETYRIEVLVSNIKKMHQNESTSPGIGQISIGSPSYDSSIKSDVNYSKAIADMKAEKVYLEQELKVTPVNKHLLANPDKYCTQLLIDSQSGYDSKIAGILDANIAEQQNELQKLQLTFSLSLEDIELGYKVQDKVTELDGQLNNLKKLNKNIESTLGMDKNLVLTIQNSQNQLTSSSGFESFYENNKNKLNYLPLKSAINRKYSQESQLKSAQQNIKIYEENFNIAKKQSDNMRSAIERSLARPVTHNQSYYLFTSLTPNTSSFSKETWKINHVSSLAKQILRNASNKVLNMQPNMRNISRGSMQLLAEDMVNSKRECSYLASFDDANSCLIALSKLQERLSYKNEKNYGSIKNNFTLKIYSKELRKSKKVTPKIGEQMFDDNLLEQINKFGLVNFNLDEEFLKTKASFLRNFDEDYYRANIVGMTVNIYQDNPIDREYISYPFDSSANIAYLLHDGLHAKSPSLSLCSDSYSNYSKRLYENYKTEMTQVSNMEKYKSLGKIYANLFSVEPMQQMMCGKIQPIYSPLVNSSNSLIHYVDTNGIERPITVFSESEYTEEKANMASKLTSFTWLNKLYNDSSSAPSVDDGYWQPLTGYISDSTLENSNLKQLSSRIYDCLISNDIDSSHCAIARKSSYQSLVGFPLLGKYTFVYAQHSRDDNENFDKEESDKTKIQGIEINFIISK